MYKDGTLLQTPALILGGKGCYNKERGLLGVGCGPGPRRTNHGNVHLFYTFKKHAVCPTGESHKPGEPRLLGSHASPWPAIPLDPSSEQVLVDNIPSPGNHNAGDLHFGKDGYLYISVGDGECDYIGDSGCNGAERRLARPNTSSWARYCAYTRDGSIPETNPYTGPDSDRCNHHWAAPDVGKNCQETFAWGFRNPFRMAFDPNASGTRVFRMNDVGGQNVWEEVDQGQRPGPTTAGTSARAAHDNPYRSGLGGLLCGTTYTPPDPRVQPQPPDANP